MVKVGRYFTIKNGVGCREQGEYARQLNVGPRIVALFEDGYAMETVHDKLHAQSCPLLTIFRIMGILDRDVWGEASYPEWNWHEPFNEWASKQPYDCMPLKEHLYPMVPRYFCKIHGDPTLSNALYDEVGNLLLIDPIRATGKIPGFVHVDVGKLMQSAIGWEHVAYGWNEPEPYVAVGLAARLLPEEHLRTMFWLGVHALRIIPYASTNPIVAEWALDVAKTIFREMKWETPCSTLTTLMEHSLTHGKRCSFHTGQSE